MAEGDGLENRYTRKGIKGSNPLLSAKCCLPAGLIKYSQYSYAGGGAVVARTISSVGIVR